MAHGYYLSRKDELLGSFLDELRVMQNDIDAVLAGVSLDDLIDTLSAEFEDVLSALPWVGGDDGRMTQYFEANTGVIALGRVLLAQKVSKDDTSRLLQTLFLGNLRKTDKSARFAMGADFMSPENLETLRTLAKKSRKRQNAGDFVYTFLEAGVDEDGEAFEFGLNYHECGFCKLCANTGDTDVLPMICGMDEESYALRGVRLKRTQTLASGARYCNFRYSRLSDGEEDA